MALLRKIIPGLLALALTSCYEDFTPKTDTRPVLCMNSLITAGEPIEVRVTRTWVYTDIAAQRGHSVKDAKISVYANGELRDDSYIPQEGDHIRLVAESPGFDPAEAEVTVPLAVPFSSVKCEPTVSNYWIDDSNGMANMSIRFNTLFTLTISDMPDAVNYYRFSYKNFYESFGNLNSSFNYFTPGYFNYESEPIFSEHIGVFESVMGCTAWGFAFFTDRQFSGKDYTLHILFTDADYTMNLPEFDESYLDCGYILTLSTVTESFYNYANYKWQLSDGFIYDMSDVGLSDPIQGYSNVSTGAGIVAAQTHSSYTINLKDFLKNWLEENQLNNRP